jgi:hypothetical protein
LDSTTLNSITSEFISGLIEKFIDNSSIVGVKNLLDNSALIYSKTLIINQNLINYKQGTLNDH